LTAVFTLPGPAYYVSRNVIGEPFRYLAELLDRANIGLLVELPQRSRPWILAGIDAALRHLPYMGVVNVLRPVDAPANEDEALAIEHGHAGAGAIGQRFEGRHDKHRAFRPGASLRLARV